MEKPNAITLTTNLAQKWRVQPEVGESSGEKGPREEERKTKDCCSSTDFGKVPSTSLSAWSTPSRFQIPDSSRLPPREAHTETHTPKNRPYSKRLSTSRVGF